MLLAGLLVLAASPAVLGQTWMSSVSLPGTLLFRASVDLSGVGAQMNGLNVTFFLPNDSAWLAMLSDLGLSAGDVVAQLNQIANVLRYHVLPNNALRSTQFPLGTTSYKTLLANRNLAITRSSSGVSIKAVGSDATVTQADVVIRSNVVHVINAVLLPFFKNIASAAARTPSLSTLLLAVQKAGLAQTLSDPKLRVTVFAPTNDAFTATLTALGISASALLDNPTLLGDILRYHVVPQRVPSSAITGTINTPTWLAGKNLTVARTAAGGVKVTAVGGTEANVVAADVAIGLGTRSVVHVIDAVLIPFPTTVAVAARNAGLSTLLVAVQNSDPAFLTALTDPKTKATVLAPTEAAFASLLATYKLTPEQLLADKANLKKILAAHVILGAAVKSTDLTNGQVVTTFGGANLTVTKTASSVSFAAAKSNAKVVVADVAVNAGTAQVHVIDTVLLPTDITLVIPPPPAPTTIYSAILANNLHTLLAAVDAAGLKPTLSSTALTYTVFAPTDAAFASAIADLGTTANDLLALGADLVPLLTYHVLGSVVPAAAVPTTPTAVKTLAGLDVTVTRTGSSVSVKSVGSDATVIAADVAAGSSLVHVVDTVLLPFFKSVASAAARTPSLSTLLLAVQKAGLAQTLSDPKLRVTVFAPTNDAFTATLTALGISASALLDNPTLLGDILRYHVVPQRVPSSAITGTITAPTLLSGKSLTVAAVSGGVKVTAVGGTVANVVAADIQIGLGRSVVHVIDAVLIPFPTTVAVAARNAGLNTLLAALTASDPAFLTALTDPKTKATVLAPTDAAFNRLLSALRISSAQLLADKANLKKILAAHVIPGVAARASDLSNGQELTTFLGAKLKVLKGWFGVRFAAAKSTASVVNADVAVNAGTAQVHVIDTVLLPADATIPQLSWSCLWLRLLCPSYSG
ncbi:hypothetical protein HYH03_012859 [Edaphochlamys debaryana]|uniref:FAS1 domain-containing protein n=1 Tax=Edaphochlamys debaryana TaxID=47281 RepID=A0A835XX94_9CHLO|nr:hypothetical protein HYH03_012859 [Edaphochlamys debaryana]|eukprot:KAG2488540.1 hypothetical protein HYH03_012859 [Edaphochlamys debaryana]